MGWRSQLLWTNLRTLKLKFQLENLKAPSEDLNRTNLVQKASIFFENRKVLKLFRFSYKIVKTANSETAFTSDNTWIWRLKFGLQVHNESYSIIFTHIFDFKRK
jgi:hypothetical protein